MFPQAACVLCRRMASKVFRVADAALVEDEGGARRVVAELAAETSHERANRVGGGVLAPVPHPAEQRVVGHDPTRVEREHPQQLVLGGGERDRVACR